MFDVKAAKNNFSSDLRHAKPKEIAAIHNELVKLLKKYDDDFIVKEIGDKVSIFFSFSVKAKCEKRFNDLIEEYEKITDLPKKQEFELDVVHLINIHKSIFEKTGALFMGL